MITVYYNTRRVVYIDETPQDSSYNESNQTITKQGAIVALPTNTSLYIKSYDDLTAAKADLEVDFGGYDELNSEV